MLVVMKFERLLGKIRLERFVGIGKIGQAERHLGLLVGDLVFGPAPWAPVK
jgi:hypothetical protein